jgi:hypothetical protein
MVGSPAEIKGATHFAPGKTIREFHELVQSTSGIDLLKDFGHVRARGAAGIYKLNFLRPSKRSDFREWIFEQTLALLRAGGADQVDEGA